jgi:CysZ protein
MQDILDALTRAFKSLLNPKMLVLTLWPMLLALAFWGVIAWIFWDRWAADLNGFVVSVGAEDKLAEWGFKWLTAWLITALIISLLLPVIYVTALAFAAIFAMPVMLNFVAARDYPELEKKHGGTFIGSVWNTVVAIVVFLVLWVVTLPLWLFPLGVVIVPTLLGAYLNQRLFRYDALADHASKEEYALIRERAHGRLFMLGGILGLAHYIPVLNFFTPIYIGLAFIHLCLAELRRLRSAG